MTSFFPQLTCVEHGVFSEARPVLSVEFLNRIKHAYREATGSFRGTGDSMWSLIGDENRPTHEALMSDDDRLAIILSDPGKTNLFKGFDNLFLDGVKSLKETSDDGRAGFKDYLAGNVIRLAEAVGGMQIYNLEGGVRYAGQPFAAVVVVEEALKGIEAEMRLPIDFPNPFSDEFGILTSRGVVSYRSLQAIYQSYRLTQLASEYGGKIIEIGAGLGRNAYYANRFGLTDYTIIDIPLTNVAQAAFLALTLGEKAVSLTSEAFSLGQVRIRTPEWLHKTSESFDVALNVDSMVEIDETFAEEYGTFFSTRTKIFLSINHEANNHRVREIKTLASLRSRRFPYWMRNGYAEEIYTPLPAYTNGAAV